nr:15088_t:CDS:2 [Entrophospora candida]CAG8480564.1 6927_t:CDS:2 [Entrophospora candida]
MNKIDVIALFFSSFIFIIHINASTDPLCVGHRGYTLGGHPENTLISLEKAISAGADGLESDVRLTKDGEVIMIHDDSLNKTTNGTGLVIDHDWNGYIEYLKTKDGTANIPRFQDVLNLLKKQENKNIFLIRSNPIQIIDKMAEIFDKSNSDYDFGNQIFLGVWTYEFYLRTKKLIPKLPISYIGDDISIARENYFDYIESYNMEYPQVLSDHTKFTKTLCEKGRKMFVWTVNEDGDLKSVMNYGHSEGYGVYGILSDDVVKCIRVREKILRRRKFWRQF